MGFSLTANQITAFSSADLSAPFEEIVLSLCTFGLSTVTMLKSVGTTFPVASLVVPAVTPASRLANNGDTVGEAGTINMDGAQYASPFDSVAYNFVADEGSSLDRTVGPRLR